MPGRADREPSGSIAGQPPGRHPALLGGVQAERLVHATVRLAIGFAGTVAGLFVLGLLTEQVQLKELAELDAYVTPALHQLASTALDVVMNAASAAGSNDHLLALAVVVVVGLRVGRRPVAQVLFLITAFGGSVALNEIMKLIFERPRPQLPWAAVLPDYSFPSGHAMNTLALFGAIAILVWLNKGSAAGRVAVAVAIGLAVLIGSSRLYLGYHYLSDVAGGLAAAVVWLAITGRAFRAALGPANPDAGHS